MSRRQKLIFVALCLLPFALAAGFRTVDNYQFQLAKQRLKKEKSDYYPQSLGPEEQNPEHEFTCHQHMTAADSVGQAGIMELP